MKRIISLAALTVIELPPPEMVSCAAQAGYSHVGLRLLPVIQQDFVHPVIGDTPMRREVLKRLEDTGVRVLDIEFIRLEPGTRVADFIAMLETGARLGAKHVLAGANDPDPQRLAERFGELCDAAASFGLRANLEPIALFEVRTLAHAARILDAADRPNSGIVIDPIHFDRSGDSYDDIARVPLNRLSYVQLCDATAERPVDAAGLQFQARYERLIPGEGGLDLLGLLCATPRDIPISVEVPMASLARSVGAVDRARRLLAATQLILDKLERRGVP